MDEKEPEFHIQRLNNADSVNINNTLVSKSKYFSYQWDMKKITNDGKAYQLIPQNINKQVIAVIDSGIDFQNPSLKSSETNRNENFVSKGGVTGNEKEESGRFGLSTDYLGHGTNVAGQISGDNELLGTAPGAKLESYRIFDQKGNSKLSWVLQAIIVATNNHVRIINLSLGRYVDTGRWGRAEVSGYRRAINYAIRHGVLVVASLGNDGINEQNQEQMQEKYKKNHINVPIRGKIQDYPADIYGVIKVGSSNVDDDI